MLAPCEMPSSAKRSPSDSADTGLTWGAQFIVGGRNRFDVKQDNRAVVSLSYGF